MQLIDWIPALTATGALSVVLWLLRSVITTRLTNTVKHEFDAKLEHLKAEFRASERTLEAKLAQRSAELEALRSGALGGIAQRRALLDKRRLEAIDQLWGTLIRNQSSRSLAMTMAVMNLEELGKQVKEDRRVSEFVKVAGGGFEPSKQDHITGSLARPYVSDMAWAIFSAIQAITSYYVAHWVALSNGIDSRKMVANESVHKLILAVMPEYKEFLEKSGLSSAYHLLEQLDLRLIKELNRMALDHQQDKDSIQQAAEILEHARKLDEQAHAAAG
jgi:hypothetical protein